MIGAHFSIAGGLEKAIYQADELNCRVLQIFTKNARSWQEKELTGQKIELFQTARQEARIACVMSHASYLINIAARDTRVRTKSIHALSCEMHRSSLLNIDYVVLHPGAYISGDENKGIRRAVESLRQVLTKPPENCPRLLLETTAGQGTTLGYSFEQLAMMIEQTDVQDLTGICLDTSHVFAAGYDLRSKSAYQKTFDQFEDTIGFCQLYAMHLNDSKTGLGSRKDRHDHIGRGEMGTLPFSMIMNDKKLSDLPKILETPKLLNGQDMDRINLKVLVDLLIP